jgi:sulfoacetaldehyde dehydrogenase
VSIPAAAQFVKTGKLKALAVSTVKRSAAFPDVPTVQEPASPTSWPRAAEGVGGTPEKLGQPTRSRSGSSWPRTPTWSPTPGRAAQRIADGYDQARVDDLVAAAGWAIMEPARNRELAELAVADTGIGNVDDKIRKNHRKTLGLLRDLQGAKSVGVIAEDPTSGIVEIARPVGVVCAITPSTNPGATPANKIINALKGRNAVIVAPSPKGWSTAARLLEFIHAQFDRIGAPRDLVQLLPAPVSKAVDRRADAPVRPGGGHRLAGQRARRLHLRHAGLRRRRGQRRRHRRRQRRLSRLAADRVLRSKTFDNATSCSFGEQPGPVGGGAAPMLAALKARGAVLLDADQKATLQALMWPDGKLSAAATGQSARRRRARRPGRAWPRSRAC